MPTRCCVATVAVAVLVPCALASVLHAADGPTVNDLLLKYEQTVRRLSQVHLEVTTTTPLGEIPGLDQEVGGTTETTIYRDGDRWRVTTTMNTQRKTNGTLREIKGGNESVLGDESLFVAWVDQAAGGRDHQIAAWLQRVHAEPQFFQTGLREAEVLFGRLPADRGETLWDVLRAAAELELLPDRERIGAVDAYVVRSRGQTGIHTLWLDPDHGCLPRRIEIRREAGELRGRRGPNFRPPPGVTIPVVKAWEERIDGIVIEVKNGIPVITAFEQTAQNLYEGGKRSERITKVRVKSIELGAAGWPADALRGSAAIPDGTAVTMYGGPDEKPDAATYEWRTGRVQVKK